MPTQQPTQREWLGYLCVILAATCWGTAGTLAKHMMNQAISPTVLAEMRVTVGAGVLFLFILCKAPHLLRIRRQDILYMIILGVVGFAGVHYSYYYAISKTNTATAILLQYLAPAFIMLIAVGFQGEPFSFSKLLALGFAFVGCFLMVGGYDLNLFEANRAGLFGGLIAAGFYTFYTLYGEYGIKKYPVWTILLYAFAAATGFWWCLNPPWKILTAGYSLHTWYFFLFLGLFSAVMPFSLYFTGIRYLRSTRASITAMVEPVVAGVVAYVFLGEVMFGPQLIGAVMVIVGIVLLHRD